MMKKIFLFLVFVFSFLFFVNFSLASWAPSVSCVWLPWCPDTSLVHPSWANVSSNFESTFVWKATIDLVVTFIKYIAAIAVISVMIGWIMYMISWGEEEKVKKAKSWILWSIVWVLLSISAFWIIRIITLITINN